MIGENLAYQMRSALYSNYIGKHIGFYDDIEHSPSAICSTLSGDASIINGAATEGVAVTIEAQFCMIIGLVIGCFYSWKMALVCIVAIPMMGIASVIRAKF